jgi:hypothetical protein
MALVENQQPSSASQHSKALQERGETQAPVDLPVFAVKDSSVFMEDPTLGLRPLS